MHSDADGQSPPQINQRLYERITTLAYEHCGVDLRRGKEQLVSVRLGKKMRELDCESYESYFHHVEQDGTGESLIAMIDALTTNYTSFLREASHFEFMRQQVLPLLAGRDRIEIWSAASSTGEEVFSILFTLLDHFSLDAASAEAARRLKVVGTDISSSALRVAQAAVYPEARLEGLPAGWLRRFFLRGMGRQAGHYRVKPELRKMVEFMRFNLIEPDRDSRLYPLIFCRNVMIYFDKPTQGKVVNTLTRRLEPEGFLFIGHAESLTGVEHDLNYLKPAVFRRAGARVKLEDKAAEDNRVAPSWGTK